MKRNTPQKRYEERQRESRGMVKVCIWIPASAKQRVLKMAAELRRLAGGES